MYMYYVFVVYLNFRNKNNSHGSRENHILAHTNSMECVQELNDALPNGYGDVHTPTVHVEVCQRSTR